MVLQFGVVDSLVPFVVVVGALVVIFGFVLLVVYLDHRKEMALIEAGAYEQVREDNRAWILGGGLLLLAIGLGTVVERLLSGGVVDEGITAAFVGVAALVYYGLKRRQDRTATAGEAPGTGESGTDRST